jgi:hypothetical protein
MTHSPLVTSLWTGLYFLVELAFIVRAIVRPHREPSSRVAWVVVIVVFPVFGVIAYILLDETNMDRRSFELNYENNILFYDSALTAEVCQRQDVYLAQSHRVMADRVAQWPLRKRLWNNAIAMLGPVL